MWPGAVLRGDLRAHRDRRPLVGAGRHRHPRRPGLPDHRGRRVCHRPPGPPRGLHPGGRLPGGLGLGRPPLGRGAAPGPPSAPTPWCPTAWRCPPGALALGVPAQIRARRVGRPRSSGCRPQEYVANGHRYRESLDPPRLTADGQRPPQPSGRTAGPGRSRTRRPTPPRRCCPPRPATRRSRPRPTDRIEPDRADREDRARRIDRQDRSGRVDRQDANRSTIRRDRSDQRRSADASTTRGGRSRRRGHDRLAGGGEDVPEPAGVGQGLTGGLARSPVRRPQVEGPPVVGDLGGAVGARVRAEQRRSDARSGHRRRARPGGSTTGGHCTAQMP